MSTSCAGLAMARGWGLSRAGARLRRALPARRYLSAPVAADAAEADGAPSHAPRASMADFHYSLPDELIARYPVSPRDSSRLLVSLAVLPADGRASSAGAVDTLAAHVARTARGLQAERVQGGGDRAAPAAARADWAGEAGREGPEPGDFVDCSFGDVARLLPEGAHLVFNESRVFAARLIGSPLRRGAAAGPAAADEPVEVLLLSPDERSVEPSDALGAPVGAHEWRAMVRADVGPGARFAVGGAREGSGGMGGEGAPLLVEVCRVYSRWVEEGERDGVEAAVKLRAPFAPASTSLGATLELLGQIPIPPYLRRGSEPSDATSYQTVFSRVQRTGSVAAPTAGLHFTERTLAALAARSIASSRVSLHVGAGTFRPVVSACIAQHTMHAEPFSLDAAELRKLAASADASAPIVAVGTTSARALESSYWLGVRALLARAAGGGAEAGGAPLAGAPLHLGQWEPYELAARAAASGSGLPSTGDALRALSERAQPAGAGGEEGGEVRASTSLCISPGYDFRVASGLLTNLHQPDSTLLLLVGALIGGPARVLRLYAHAIARRYRFLSYGDACLLVSARAMPAASERARPEQALAPPARAAAEAAGAEGGDIVAGGAHAPAAGARWWGGRSAVGKRVLLHSCCAPCSGAMIAEMREAGLDVTIFFYNPNIQPRKEYELRKAENVRYAQQLGVPFVDADYDVEEWFKRAKGLELSPERGARCTMCFDMRMERTALHAHEHGFGVITTTNATSRWKDAAQVDASGERAAAKYAGVEYWHRDWQTDAMSARKYEINAQQRFYKQEYCGCTYSLRDTNLWRAKQGMPPVDVGSQESVYSDPAADSEEESREVVDGFFRENKAFEEELRGTYGRRRKGGDKAGASDNNW